MGKERKIIGSNIGDIIDGDMVISNVRNDNEYQISFNTGRIINVCLYNRITTIYDSKYDKLDSKREKYKIKTR